MSPYLHFQAPQHRLGLAPVAQGRTLTAAVTADPVTALQRAWNKRTAKVWLGCEEGGEGGEGVLVTITCTFGGFQLSLPDCPVSLVYNLYT